MKGTWAVKSGSVVLAKEPGTSAMAGTIIVGGSSENDSLVLERRATRSTTRPCELLARPRAAQSLNLNGFSDTIAKLTLAAGTTVQTERPAGGGVLAVRELVVEGKSQSRGIYTSSSGVAARQRIRHRRRREARRRDGQSSTTRTQTIGAGNMAVLKVGDDVQAARRRVHGRRADSAVSRSR